jgi:hypothetical protein
MRARMKSGENGSETRKRLFPKELTDFYKRALKFLPTHIEQFDDAAIDESSRDHAVAKLFFCFVQNEEDGSLDFGEAIPHVGDIRVARFEHRGRIRS